MTRRPSRLTLQTLEDRWTPAAAGTLDPTFGVGGVVTLASPSSSARFMPSSAIVTPDGRIVVAGAIDRTSTSGPTVFVVRYTPDGRLDPTFGRAGVLTLTDIFPPQIFAVDSAGRALVTGVGTTGLSVRRLTPDGRIDATFGEGGQASVVTSADPSRPTITTAVALQADGRIVLVGTDGVGRLTPDGQPDASFGTGGGVRVSFPINSFDAFVASSVAVLSDSRIVVAGRVKVGTSLNLHYGFNFDSTDAAVVQLTSTGRLDSTFGKDGRVQIPTAQNDEALRVQVVGDGRLLVTGRETTRQTGIETTSAAFALRFDGTGQPDSGYGTGGRVTQLNFIDSAFPAADGRVVFANARNDGLRLQRLTPDGRVDVTFRSDFLPNLTDLYCPNPVVTADGSLLLTGNDTRPSEDSPRPVIFRVLGTTPVFPTPTGTVLIGGPIDGTVTPFQPMTDGQLLPVTPLAVYPNFPGSVRVATADVNGDGVADYVTGPGPGGGPNVVVTDGKTGAVLANLNAFETTFTGGVFVAAADLNGDGKADVVVTPDQGGGPVVAIYDGAGLAAGKNAAAELTRFFGIDDTAFRGGARPALGDMNGDGRPDLIVAAGFGGGPRVAIYDGTKVAFPGLYELEFPNPPPVRRGGPPAVFPRTLPPKLTADFFVFEPTLRNGVFVAAGDLNGDGKAEVVFGGGPGGGPRVLAFDGAALTAGQQKTVVNIFAGDPGGRGGVRVAVRAAADGSMQLVTGSGEGQPGRVGVYTAATALAGGLAADQVVSPFCDGPLTDGVFVG